MKVLFGINCSLNSFFNGSLRYCFRCLANSSTIYPKISLMELKNRKNKIMLNDCNISSEKERRAMNNELSKQRINGVKKSLTERYNVTFAQTPIKSETDDKEYLVMQLSNGLTALLISDISSLMNFSDFKSDVKTQNEILEYGVEVHDKSVHEKEKLAACSVTVGVGSYEDPHFAPGLAHLVEHMLFMGSEKFPTENDFNSFVTARGGSSNAFTESECTTFFFDCPEIFMEEILDRFANFFISPLMRRETMVKEIQVIESEFQMHSKTDSLRLQQIIASMATVENPAGKFMWGNLKTLKEGVDEEKLYNSLREFQKTHYSANRMLLAIQARLPLNTLGRWVVETFSKVPTNDSIVKQFSYVNPPFEPESFNKLYTVMPVSDVNLLKLTWAFPPILHMYRSKPSMYASFMLNNESKGSLLSHLKKNLWALDMVAGTGNDSNGCNSIFSMFSVGLLLTEKGLKNIDKVLYSVFSYIKMLQSKGLCETVFSELKYLAETSFRFSPQVLSSENVQFLSQNMRLYPPLDYVTGSALLLDCVPEHASCYLDQFQPDNVNIMLASKLAANDISLDRTEKWFGTKYHTGNIPETWLNEWKDARDFDAIYSLPQQNRFIPSDFSIIPVEGDQPLHPENLVKDKYMELWFKQDSKFRLPYAYVKLYMISPYTNSLPETSVMSELFASLFSVLYDEELFSPAVAGLTYSLTPGDCGLILSVSGYNEKLQTFLGTVVDLILALGTDLTPDVFEAVKETQSKVYYNNLLNPTGLAKELRMSVLCDPFCTSITKLEAISSTNVTQLQRFSEIFFRNMYVKCLIQGNMSKEQAMNFSQMVRMKFDYLPLLGTRPKTRVRQLPNGEYILRVKALNEEDKNCHVTNYYQCGLGDDLKENCLVELLMMNMEEPLFDTLRTKEQLGYYVNNDMRYTYGILGFTVAVKFQADKFTVQHVESRMTDFLTKMKSDLKNMTTEDFNRLKTSTKLLKQQVDTNLSEEIDRNWFEIESDEYIFDRLKLEANQIEALEKKDLYNYFSKLLNSKKEAQTRERCLRKISFQVDGSDSQSNRSQESLKDVKNLKHILEVIAPQDSNGKEAMFVKDIEDFQTGLYIYPVVNRKSK